MYTESKFDGRGSEQNTKYDDERCVLWRLQATRQYREGSHAARRVTSRPSSSHSPVNLPSVYLLSTVTSDGLVSPVHLFAKTSAKMPTKEELLTQAQAAKDPRQAEALYKEILGEQCGTGRRMD